MTPESKIPTRASPRSLRQVSKRKLDLNCLIDHMPDKEFITIKTNSLLENVTNSRKHEKRSGERKKSPEVRRPLTEHQKEVRKERSFIPLEVQSVFINNTDSQMSCCLDEDTSTQSSNLFAASFSKGMVEVWFD